MVKQGKERKVKDISKAKHLFKYPEVGVPFLWPFSFFIGLEEEVLEVLRDNLKYLKEVEKTQVEKPKPIWSTKNKVKLDLKTLILRDFSHAGAGIYTFVVPLMQVILQ